MVAIVHSSGPLFDLLESAKGRFPNRPAIESAVGNLTYSELHSRVLAVASDLAAAGVHSGDVVGVLSDDDLGTVVAMYAVSRLGASWSLVVADWPTARRESCLNLVGARGVVIASDVARGDVHLEAYNGRSARGLENIAYVAFTSGSSGEPKGVAISNDSHRNLIEQQIRVYRTKEYDRILQWSSWGFDASVFDVSFACCGGGCLVLVDAEEKLPGRGLEKTLVSKRITVAGLTPSCLVRTRAVGGDLRLLISAGESLSASCIESWLEGGKSVYNAYGPAEACIWSTCRQLGGVEDVTSAGWPIENVRVRVWSDSRGDFVVDEVGEVVIDGVSVGDGYLGPGGSLLPFAAGRGPSQNGKKEYWTGDRGIVTADGELFLKGRADRQIKLHGARVELDEIDRAIVSMGSVRMCATCATGELDSQRLTSFVVPVSGHNVGVRDVSTHLLSSLPRYFHPSEIRIVSSIPMTSNGKIDYAALESMVNMSTDRAEVSFKTEVGDPLVADLQEIWKNGLKVESVDPDGDFFEIGGTSFVASLIVADVTERFGAAFTLRELFECRTVNNVAALLGESR